MPPSSASSHLALRDPSNPGPQEGVRQRLSRRAWAADWPEMIEDPATLPPPDLSPVGWWESWPTFVEEAQALQGGLPLPLNRIHAFLDRLESWSFQASPFLTWPPTQQGFAQALAASLDRRDPDVLAVIASHPRSCAQALALVADPGLHEASQELTRQLRTVFAPSPEPEVKAVLAEADGSPPGPQEVKADVRKPKDTAREGRPAPAPEVTRWLRLVLDRLYTPEGREPELREWLDEQWKHLRQQERADIRAGWLLERWLPALATLGTSDLQLLQEFWPTHQRIAVPDPLALVTQKRFWAVLRDATARTELTTRALPGFIDAEGWSFEQRHGLLEPMFHMVRANADVFEERLQMWIGWGGRLDEEALLSAPPPEGGDVFAHPTPPEPVSARAWFLSHENGVWNEVLARHPPPRPRHRP